MIKRVTKTTRPVAARPSKKKSLKHSKTAFTSKSNVSKPKARHGSGGGR